MNALRSPRTRAHFPAGIERLEDRIAPANNVTATLVAGTLTITTVDELGEAEILTFDNNQNFQILAAGPGNVTLHKSAATDINGGVADVAFTGVVNIVVDLKDGNDTLVLKGGVDIPGDLTYKGGDGGGLLEVDGDAGTSSFRNFTYLNGDGVENLTFKDGNINISEKLKIDLGEGGANLNIGFNITDNVTIGGDLSIVAGAGNEGLNYNGANLLVKGAVSMKFGPGNGFVSFKTQNSTVIEKPVIYVNGPGDGTFEVNSQTKTSSFAGIKITNGAGNNRVTFDASVSDAIHGDIIVTNGAGNNRVEVNSLAFAVDGKVKITNGAGNNVTDITPDTTNTVGGDFTLTNPAGDDTTTIGGTDVTYKNVKLVNGNGASTTNLPGTNLSFASISSTSGDGADFFAVNATGNFEIVTGGLTLKQGNGTTSTTIGAAGTAAIAGALSITNGDGADTQVIGNGAGNFSGLHEVKIVNGRGGSTTNFNPAQVTIAGSVSVTSGEGADTFRMGNGALTSFNISGAIKLTHGAGGSTSLLNPTTGGNLAGAFTVTGGDGNDTVDVIRSTLGGAMTVNLGTGNDTVEIDNSILAALKLVLGSGNDEVRIEHETNDSVNTTILGAVSVDTGRGDDDFLWGLDANDFVVASQSVKLLGGVGLDTFNQSAATNTFVLPPVLTSIEVQLP